MLGAADQPRQGKTATNQEKKRIGWVLKVFCAIQVTFIVGAYPLISCTLSKNFNAKAPGRQDFINFLASWRLDVKSFLVLAG